MACAVGANDVANAMGPSVGARVLNLKTAVIIAAIFEAAGALLASGQVTQTISKGILDISPDLDVYFIMQGMLSALLASGVWLIIATYFGWPVSTTHTIIGSVIGFGLFGLGFNKIHWDVISSIVLSWFLTPLIGGLLSYTLFQSSNYFVFYQRKPLSMARWVLTFYLFLVSFVFSMVTTVQCLKVIKVSLSFDQSLFLSIVVSLIVSFVGYFAMGLFVKHRSIYKFMDQDYVTLEKMFGFLVICTACAMAFAHGSNDVANAIGPLAAILSLYKGGIAGLADATISIWLVALGACGVVCGLAVYGYKVIETVGSQITSLTPSRAFAVQLATASTVVFSSGLGLPVSTTHTLVGALLGVGFARGISSINLEVVSQIFMSWFITLPVGGVLTIIIMNLMYVFL